MMKTVFDQSTRDELIGRIRFLEENSAAQWGKMNVYQVLKHLFGKIALKSLVKDDSPLRRSTPTIPELIITGSGDVMTEKAKWIAQLEAYDQFSDPDLVHPFFGKMTGEEIGYLVYKHTDHHLRQFNH